MSKEKKKSLSLKQEIKLLKYSVGIDVSKDKFDGLISVIDSEQKVKVIASKQFANSKSGFNELQEWVGRKCKMPIPIVFIMEATGVYYENLAFYLHRNDFYLSVVLPNKAKKYMQSLGLKSKNDKIDAQGLSRMAAEQCLEKWEAPDEAIMNLRGITRQRESLQNIRTQINNQLLAYQCSEFKNKFIINQLESTIALLNQQIKETEVLVKEEIQKDEETKTKVENITEISGLGIITVATVLAETNKFKYFRNQRQLVSYSGYDIIENQSGKHVGKTKISKKGNSHIRRILHMPAFSVVSNNEPVFKALYERVYARTKFKMKGYVAVQRKLLIMIYTLWKTGNKYERKLDVTYGNDEQKILFPLGFEKTENNIKNSRWEQVPPTQDELTYKESQSVLFPLEQR
jgi:transposase